MKKYKWLSLSGVTFSDTETTGLNTGYYDVYDSHCERVETRLIDGEDEARIIELAGMSFNQNGAYDGFYSDINRTDILVGPIAAATHGYTNKMLENAPKFKETESYRRLKADVDAGNYIVFHNAPFDVKMLNIHDFGKMPKVIDTLQVCKHLYLDGLIGLDDARYYKVFSGEVPKSHQLQYFRYLFEMDDQPYFKEAMKMANLKEIKPHTALSDVFILWLFTAKLMHDFNISLEQMQELSLKPVLLKDVSFGKYRKSPKSFNDIISSVSYTSWGAKQPGYEYLQWAFENMNLNADLEYSINYYMGKAILDGIVPFRKIKTKDYTVFLFNAIRTSFSKEEILQALQIMGRDESFYEIILNNVESKVLRVITVDEVIPDGGDVDKALSVRNNRAFFLTYVNKYRKNILN